MKPKFRIHSFYILEKKNDPSLIATDLKFIYKIQHAESSDEIAFSGHNAQDFSVKKIRKFTESDWDKRFNLKLAQEMLDLFKGSKSFNDIKNYILEEFPLKGRYYARHHQIFCGGDFCAYSEAHALASAIFKWSVLSEIEIDGNANIVYCNGKWDGAIQLWNNGELSRFRHLPEIGQLPGNVETLLTYAIDNKDSEWRKNKKWQEILKMEDVEISDFKTINSETSHFLSGHEKKEMRIAKTDNGLLLVETCAGGMYGGEGDYWEEKYLLSEKDSKYLETLKLLS